MVRKELDVVPLLFEYSRRHRPGDKTFPAVIGAPQEQDIVLVRKPCRVSVIRVNALLLVMGTNDQPRQAVRAEQSRIGFDRVIGPFGGFLMSLAPRSSELLRIPSPVSCHVPPKLAHRLRFERAVTGCNRLSSDDKMKEEKGGHQNCQHDEDGCKAKSDGAEWLARVVIAATSECREVGESPLNRCCSAL